MGKRLEMPPQCVRCAKAYPEFGKYCQGCLAHATWLEAIDQAWQKNQVRVNHHLFFFDHPKPGRPKRKRTGDYRLEPTGGRGFGGQEFKIRFFDGRRITTKNMWSVGPIPEEYWEALPDNAAFVKERGVPDGC